MNIYYHVVKLVKDKKCKFNFWYSKDAYFDVPGNVEVNLAKSGGSVTFDSQSNNILTLEEKEEIVKCVMKNICL
ncbi:MAG: hypothetical protein HPY74_14110 [Firmicutes bacterium]|nr:hypothetical protein [Bacillota bacterium]